MNEVLARELKLAMGYYVKQSRRCGNCLHSHWSDSEEEDAGQISVSDVPPMFELDCTYNRIGYMPVVDIAVCEKHAYKHTTVKGRAVKVPVRKNVPDIPSPPPPPPNRSVKATELVQCLREVRPPDHNG